MNGLIEHLKSELQGLLDDLEYISWSVDTHGIDREDIVMLLNHTGKDCLDLAQRMSKRPTLAIWKQRVTLANDMCFAPASGICFACRGDLVDHWIKTGAISSTHCPMCNATFVD